MTVYCYLKDTNSISIHNYDVKYLYNDDYSITLFYLY